MEFERLNLLSHSGESVFSIDYYTNYQFHENDDYNLAKIGRRWFGDRFDFENIKSFSFDFDNLLVDKPVNLKISAAATSEIVTTMSVELNRLMKLGFHCYYMSILN